MLMVGHPVHAEGVWQTELVGPVDVIADVPESFGERWLDAWNSVQKCRERKDGGVPAARTLNTLGAVLQAAPAAVRAARLRDIRTRRRRSWSIVRISVKRPAEMLSCSGEDVVTLRVMVSMSVWLRVVRRKVDDLIRVPRHGRKRRNTLHGLPKGREVV